MPGETPVAGVMFQSSPAPKDGRYASILFTACFISVFQSSPAPKDGRYLYKLKPPAE